VYEYTLNQQINLHDLVKLNFVGEVEYNDNALTIVESWMSSDEFFTKFKDKSSYFTIDPGTLIKFEIVSNTIQVIFYAAVMMEDDITDGGWGTLTIIGDKIKKFIYMANELD